MIYITPNELEYLESAITNLESGQPVQYSTEHLRSLLTKLKFVKAYEGVFTDLFDHIGNKIADETYQLDATPENIDLVDKAEYYRYEGAKTPVHIDNSGFIWTSDLVLFDYITYLAEQK